MFFVYVKSIKLITKLYIFNKLNCIIIINDNRYMKKIQQSKHSKIFLKKQLNTSNKIVQQII